MLIARFVDVGVQVRRVLTSTGRGVRVRRAFPPTGDGVKEKKLLERGQKFFGGSSWWVSELGAVSNDGTRVLAKFGVMSPPKNKMSKVVYSWYTIESSTGRILSKGLTIQNGKTPTQN